MSLQLNGKVKAIFDTQEFSSGFTKREFVITTAEQYPQDVKFELVKDKTGSIDKFAVGQSITVNFNVRGNEFGGKYYVSLQAWKLEVGQAQAAPVAAQPETDDIPF